MGDVWPHTNRTPHGLRHPPHDHSIDTMGQGHFTRDTGIYIGTRIGIRTQLQVPAVIDRRNSRNKKKTIDKQNTSCRAVCEQKKENIIMVTTDLPAGPLRSCPVRLGRAFSVRATFHAEETFTKLRCNRKSFLAGSPCKSGSTHGGSRTNQRSSIVTWRHARLGLTDRG